MSKSIIEKRKQALKEKERIMLSDIEGSSGSRNKRILLWSLAAGIIAMTGYGIYQATSDHEEIKKTKKKKKKSKGVPKDSEIIDSAIERIGPMVGKWIINFLKD